MHAKDHPRKNEQRSKEDIIAEFKRKALEERGHEITDEEAKNEIEMLDLMAKIFVQNILNESRGANKSETPNDHRPIGKN